MRELMEFRGGPRDGTRIEGPVGYVQLGYAFPVGAPATIVNEPRADDLTTTALLKDHYSLHNRVAFARYSVYTYVGRGCEWPRGRG